MADVAILLPKSQEIAQFFMRYQPVTRGFLVALDTDTGISSLTRTSTLAESLPSGEDEAERERVVTSGGFLALRRAAGAEFFKHIRADYLQVHQPGGGNVVCAPLRHCLICNLANIGNRRSPTKTVDDLVRVKIGIH